MIRVPKGPALASLVALLAGVGLFWIRSAPTPSDPWSQLEAPKTGQFRVATWNAAVDQARPASADIATYIAKILRRIAPDIVLLQHVTPMQQSTLQSQLGDSWRAITIDPSSETSSQSVVWVHLPNRPTRRFLIHPSGARQALACQVETANGTEWIVVNVNASRMDPDDRTSYFRALKNWVNHRKGARILLGGSFGRTNDANATQGSDGRVARMGDLDAGPLSALRDCGPREVPTNENVRVDSILVTDTVRPESSFVVTGAARHGLTHVPVVVDVRP